jgi:hypothetical protein
MKIKCGRLLSNCSTVVEYSAHYHKAKGSRKTTADDTRREHGKIVVTVASAVSLGVD